MIGTFKIGNITVSPNLILAPMSGVTCSAYRRLIKELNPGAVGLVISEFLSVEAMTRNSKRTYEMIRFRQEEAPIGMQIFGANVDRMRDAAMMLQDNGADFVDINCGCPAPKVVKKGGGCELMRQPELLAKIISEVKKHISIPLTIKIRSGWDQLSKNGFEIAKLAQEAGADAITVHGRTRTQMYSGEADWDLIERIAAELKIPVIGSGDVIDSASAQRRSETKVAGLMIGRASLSNPFVFSEIVSGKLVGVRQDPLLAYSVIKRYFELLLEDFPERTAIGRGKQLICRMMPRRWWWKTEILRKLKIQEILDTYIKACESPQCLELNT